MEVLIIVTVRKQTHTYWSPSKPVLSALHVFIYSHNYPGGCYFPGEEEGSEA